MENQIRNYGPIPFLEKEGTFLKEFPVNEWVKKKPSRKESTKAELGKQKKLSIQEANEQKFRSDYRTSTSMIDLNIRKEKKKVKSEKRKEEIVDKLTEVDVRTNPNWAKGLLAWQRLFAHHTLSSMRRSANFVPCNAPQNKLDFVLDSTYRHEAAVFPAVMDIYLQPETLGYETWRVLRNNKQIPQPGKVTRGHPIKFGGIKLRPNIYNVKLGIPAPHVAQTNAGYSRREDGALYKFVMDLTGKQN